MPDAPGHPVRNAMLFNSYEFILGFLPLTLALFFVIGRHSRRAAAAWLAAASLFFYGWWNPAYVGLLLGSVAFNFVMGRALAREALKPRSLRRRPILVFAVAANLALLGYYKYANFFVTNVDALLGSGWSVGAIILPLGISFFTFTQIAFLVDAWRGEAKEYDFVHYLLFVTYFPHLIAGPVLHHKEMMPQFGRAAIYRPDHEALSVGLTVFAIGLFKKVELADGVAPYATGVFAAAGHGASLDFFAAWGGALAYTLQLYFDFSGYSDMAIGLSRMFGVRVPLNFDSPYQSLDIVEFWRRWHMTLSRFLRDYLYFPLGGNRRGRARRYANLMTTMLLGGLWHGAGWTFVIWGGLHGLYLVINHAWRAFRVRAGLPAGRRWTRALAWLVTFLAVVIAWVFFRAPTLDAALSLLASMCGANGVVLPGESMSLLHWRLVAVLQSLGVQFHGAGAHSPDGATWAWIGVLLVVVARAPNTQAIVARYKPGLSGPAPSGRWWSFCIAPQWALGCVALLAMALTKGVAVSEFLYFQF